ncbi:MAG: arginine--tRNA ligase, partial [bacterium]|nr:arginine--tRNA ligase [bacterium]
MKDLIRPLLEAAITGMTGKKPDELHLEPPSDPQHGDLSTNTAMKGGGAGNPREIAQKLIDAIPKNTMIEKTEIAGPGFINFWLSDDAYRQAFSKLVGKMEEGNLGKLDLGRGKTAIT